MITLTVPLNTIDHINNSINKAKLLRGSLENENYQLRETPRHQKSSETIMLAISDRRLRLMNEILENLEKFLVVSKTDFITADLLKDFTEKSTKKVTKPNVSKPRILNFLNNERDSVIAALSIYRTKKSAAFELGCSERTLYRKIIQFNITQAEIDQYVNVN